MLDQQSHQDCHQNGEHHQEGNLGATEVLPSGRASMDPMLLQILPARSSKGSSFNAVISSAVLIIALLTFSLYIHDTIANRYSIPELFHKKLPLSIGMERGVGGEAILPPLQFAQHLGEGLA